MESKVLRQIKAINKGAENSKGEELFFEAGWKETEAFNKRRKDWS